MRRIDIDAVERLLAEDVAAEEIGTTVSSGLTALTRTLHRRGRHDLAAVLTAAAAGRPWATRTVDPPADDLPRRLGWTGQEWRLQAVCATVDPDLWFPDKGGNTRHAKRICLTCPVRRDCLEYALINREPFGIWGGLSARERQRVRTGSAA